ncbi:MAG: GNAT family N-acetyltransferase [Mariniblastus sp.]|nr:GNAT family N-acetyltransferase [Mariniblastus sp.]
MRELDFRLATLQDAERLFIWRNDPLTRSESHDDSALEPEAHRDWLRRAIDDPHRSLWVVETGGEAVGTVRADREEDGWLLSWTVAPEARGNGFGKRMVCQWVGQRVGQLDGRLRAEVRVGNKASARIAEAAGLNLAEEKAGVRYYVRDVN